MSLLKPYQLREFENKLGPLLTDQVKTILESGLMLDEDYEVLLKTANFKIYLNEGWKLPLGLIACGVTTLASVIFARRYNQPLAVVVPVGLSITKLYLEFKAVFKENRRKVATSSAIRSLIRVRKLNKAIVEYLKTRAALNSKQKESLILNNRNVEDFLKFYVETSTEILYYLLNELNFLSSLTEELIDDFQGIKELNVSVILQESNSLQPETFALKVHDLYALLTSKFLNYLGVNFCKLSNDTRPREIECLLDNTLPKLTTKLNDHHLKIQTAYNDLRYCVNKKQNIDNKKPLGRHVSGKLQETLTRSVNNLSLVMEKYQVLLGNVEEIEMNSKDFESSLADLRDHAFATYESLDVLCRLYGILSQTNKNDKNLQSENVQRTLSEETKTITTVKFDDISEPFEESYELYLEKDNNTFLEDTCNDTQQSTAYLGLMIKELEQSLKQHDRFIEARSKRGIKEEDQKSDKTSEKVEFVKKFDLTAVNPSKTTQNLSDDVSKLTTVKAAPLPPPLPDLKVDDDQCNTTSSLLNNIRALTSQMDGDVDTFGDSDVLESDC